jgi:YVTN family beta-propeller protein
MIYVTNSASNSISVINGTTERVVRTIPVDYNPRSIVINPRTDIIYVANALSGTVSVIDGKTNNVMSGVNFNVNPPNSGIISCNDKRILNNYTRYDLNTSLNCDAIPNPGFDFSSWSGDLSSNSNTTGAPTTLSDYLFGWLSARMNSSSSPNNNPMIQFPVSHYGKVNANFIQHASVSMPPEFWAAISATITSFFIPSIVGWLKGRMQRGNLRKCLDMIDSKHDKLDLNTIKNEIQELYAKGKISDSHYEVLKDKISEYYT